MSPENLNLEWSPDHKANCILKYMNSNRINNDRKKTFENCFPIKFSTGSEFGQMLAWQKFPDRHCIMPDDAYEYLSKLHNFEIYRVVPKQIIITA